MSDGRRVNDRFIIFDEKTTKERTLREEADLRSGETRFLDDALWSEMDSEEEDEDEEKGNGEVATGREFVAHPRCSARRAILHRVRMRWRRRRRWWFPVSGTPRRPSKREIELFPGVGTKAMEEGEPEVPGYEFPARTICSAKLNDRLR